MRSKLIVFVFVWSSWCKACGQLISSILKVVPSMLELKLKILNFDINCRDLIKLGIKQLPVVILFSDSKPIGIKIGSLTIKALREWLAFKLS